MPAAEFVDQADDEVDRLDFVECAIALLAARRADGLVDEGFFGHICLQVLFRLGYGSV